MFNDEPRERTFLVENSVLSIQQSFFPSVCVCDQWVLRSHRLTGSLTFLVLTLLIFLLSLSSSLLLSLSWLDIPSLPLLIILYYLVPLFPNTSIHRAIFPFISILYYYYRNTLSFIKPGWIKTDITMGWEKSRKIEGEREKMRIWCSCHRVRWFPFAFFFLILSLSLSLSIHRFTIESSRGSFSFTVQYQEQNFRATKMKRTISIYLS